MPIDIDECLKDIPGDNPAGDKDAFYLIRDELEKARQEDDLSGWGPDDPMRPPAPIRADWKKIIAVGTDALATKCKHLEIATRVTEALTKLDGFAGLTDGLTLLRRMVEECWDRMYPALTDGGQEDLEDRSGLFSYLGVENRGANFPLTVRNVPVVFGRGGGLGYAQWKDVASKEAFDAALAATPGEKLAATAGAARAAKAAVAGLSEALAARMKYTVGEGDDQEVRQVDPGLSDLQTTVTDVANLVARLDQAKNGGPVEEGPDDGSPQPADGGRRESRVTTADDFGAAELAAKVRADVYRRLREAADLLEKLEPRSPVPYLVRRAAELGQMPFPEFLRVLIRDAAAQAEIRREYGVPEPPAPPE